MSSITTKQLRDEISDILKDADLASMSTKKVREQLEKTFKCDLNSRRTEIKDIVLDIVNSKESNDEDDRGSSESEGDGSGSSESEEDEEEAPKSKKRASSGRKASPVKKKKKASSDDEENSDADANSEDDDSDAKPKKRAAKGRPKGGRKKKGSGSDSDEDWKQPKQPKKEKGKGRGTGFTRPYTLSSDLAAVVGAESLPRYEVVKKIWALIKERNLYDPKNKQFAICDPELLKVFGVKRFRTFSMLKYLKPHFID